MKIGSHALWISLAATVLCGCDEPGTTNDPQVDKRYELVLGDGSGGGGSDDSPTDTSGGGSVPVLDSSRILGPVTIVGGLERKLVFYLAPDRSLHVVASSDGTVAPNIDRLTIWDVTVSTDDSISARFTGTAENPYTDHLYWSMDNKLAFLTFYTLATAHEARIAASPKAWLTISVQARSGIRPANWSSSWNPPDIADGLLGSMVRAGARQTPIGATTFRVRMP